MLASNPKKNRVTPSRPLAPLAGKQSAEGLGGTARSYGDFLHRKSQIGGDSGFEPLWMPDFLFDFQKSLVEWAVRKGRAAIFADCGLGKGHPPTMPILTPSGFVTLGSICVGDRVIGSDGKPTKVIGVYPRGIQPIYTVRFSDETEAICDADHIWAVKSYNDVARNRPWRTMNTRELAGTKIKYGMHGQSRTWQIPLVFPVQFDPIDLPIAPYLLGVLLGDGSLSGSVDWCKPDEEIAKKVSRLLPVGCKLVRRGSPDRCDVWRILGGEFGNSTNPMKTAIESLGLWGKRSWEKFIPPAYLIADVESRISLLQGLMDTDGYAGDSPEFSSSSADLAKAVQSLVESLGGTTSLNCKEEPTYEYAGEKRIGRPSYRVVMTLPPGINPFSLSRKANNYKTASRGLGRWIDSIEFSGKGETICIKVEAPDGLFVIDRYIVTHNTPMQLVWAENVRRKYDKPVLVLTPIAVGAQTIREAQKFGIEAKQSRDGKVESGIVVTNYERLHYFNPEDFSGIVCDESSAIKAMKGKTREKVTDFSRGVRSRLLCTATAAPNDYVELGTSSEVLGEMGQRDMITMFFVQETKKDYLGWGRSKYRMKGHATSPFWKWVCSWARACRKPSDLGFSDERFALPPLVVETHKVKANSLPSGFLFDVPARDMWEERDERRRTIGERCEKVASLVIGTGKPSVIWCHLNKEASLLEELIPGSRQVGGSDKPEERERIYEEFATGNLKDLIIKPKVGAWGLNWQHCSHVLTFASHSYEQYYQAVRRCWRFGQKNSVKVDCIVTEGEQRAADNLLKKSNAADEMFNHLVSHMNDSLKINRDTEFGQSTEIPQWL